MSGVEVSIGVDLTGLQRRLTDLEVDILNSHADAMVVDIKKQWDGWLYAKIPKDYQTGRSNVAWRRGRTQSTEGLRTVEIINDAEHKDKTYAAYVHRAGSSVLEASVVINTIINPGALSPCEVTHAASNDRSHDPQDRPLPQALPHRRVRCDGGNRGGGGRLHRQPRKAGGGHP
jgi:hypothetical protein